MNRVERLRIAAILAGLAFFIQVFFMVFDVKFIDETTGQFAMGAELRFRFFDEATREFVLASQIGGLPRQLMNAGWASLAIAVLTFFGLRFSPWSQ